MPEFLRRPQHRYHDPLARIWILCAERVGFRIARTPELYASTDGRGTILIGADETLDPDDSLAQMIFHELCHALVEGDQGEAQPDWGLDNTSNRHRWREQACLRLQAYLAGGAGLRDFFAPTTDFRVTCWDTLPADPFGAPAAAGGRREQSCVAARLAAWRAAQPRWMPHLTQALAASAAIASTVRRSEPPVGCLPGSMGRGGARGTQEMPSLWSTVQTPPPLHPAGHAPVAEYYTGHQCEDCAWSFTLRNGQRCRHAPDIRLPIGAPACSRWEPAEDLDCTTCGACCREAYHAVEIGTREPVSRRHPELVESRDGRCKIRRDGDRCAALAGGHTSTEAYSCTIYPDRPRTCREFTRGSANCLDARRRVGLSL